MFPPFVRRSLRVLSAAAVLSGAGLGAVATAGASTPSTVAGVLKATKTALNKQSGVHILVNETAGKTKTIVVVDLGATTGAETITSGKKFVSVVLTPKFVYIKGSAAGLTGIMGLTAAQELKVGTKSIALAAGSTPYGAFHTSLTTGALLTFLPVVKGTTLLPAVAGSTSFRLRWSSTSSASSSKVTSLLTIAGGSSHLPTSETVTSSTGAGSTVFSRWGETVHLTVPDPSKTVTYKQVFG
jgi:hypothetical protein